MIRKNYYFLIEKNPLKKIDLMNASTIQLYEICIQDMSHIFLLWRVEHWTCRTLWHVEHEEHWTCNLSHHVYMEHTILWLILSLELFIFF